MKAFILFILTISLFAGEASTNSLPKACDDILTQYMRDTAERTKKAITALENQKKINAKKPEVVELIDAEIEKLNKVVIDTTSSIKLDWQPGGVLTQAHKKQIDDDIKAGRSLTWAFQVFRATVSEAKLTTDAQWRGAVLEAIVLYQKTGSQEYFGAVSWGMLNKDIPSIIAFLKAAKAVSSDYGLYDTMVNLNYNYIAHLIRESQRGMAGSAERRAAWTALLPYDSNDRFKNSIE